ncbi:MAG: type II secretion system protein N [Woeseiaceae bacterium]|nr:type II secretion system protein N [Woeseiaceae bacterium]
MIKKKYTLILVILFLVGIINYLPANTALQWIVPKGTLLNGVNGTIWNGTVSEAINQNTYIRDIKWKFHPTKILLGDLSFEISLYPFNGYLNAQITRSSDQTIELNNLQGFLSEGTLPITASYLGIDGQIDLDIKQLKLRGNIPVKINGDINIQSLKILGLSNQSMGNYAIKFNPTKESIIGSIEGENALLDVAGTIKIDNDGNYLISGVVAPNIYTPNDIKAFLNFLGSANDKNQREFRFEGKL